MKKIKYIGSVAALVFLLGGTAQAAEFITGESKTEANVSTLSQEVHKNLYIAGGSVTVNSATAGDLVAAGGMVTVNGNVEKDLMVAGGNLNLNGSVGENARVGGGNVSINAPIAGDLLVGGGNVTIAEKATVGGDLVVGAGNVSVDSNIQGNVKIGGGNVTINGRVTGNVEVAASQTLTFGAMSEVLGKITYKGPNEAVVKPGAKIGTIDYTKVTGKPAHRGGFIGIIIIGSLFKLLMLLVAAVAMIWLVRARVAAVVTHAIQTPGRSLGIGVLTVIAAPILGVLLMITVVGLYVGVILLLTYALLVAVSSVISLFYTGRLVWGWYQKEASDNAWRDLGIGALLTLILGFIPIVGWIAIGVLWVITLGALATHLRREFFLKP